MKLEYLPEGTPECPLIRLFEFSQAEAKQFSELVKLLGAGNREKVVLHNETWVVPVGECSVNLRRGEWNQGMRRAPSGTFEWVLSAEGWRNVEGLLEPFCDIAPTGFQWLTSQGEIAVLISTDGQW